MDRERLHAQERALAEHAGAFARRLIEASGNRVVLTNIRHDAYGGRINADAELADGSDLWARLLAAHVVIPYNGRGRKPTWCGRAAGPL